MKTGIVKLYASGLIIVMLNTEFKPFELLLGDKFYHIREREGKS